MKFIGIIPARYASTRFPGKPLAMINGKSMIMRVYEQAIKASCFTQVMVATDDERIFKHVEENGGRAIMTSTEHRSGTDRTYEVVSNIIEDENTLNNTVVINVQGDEPYIHPSEIERLADCFQNPDVDIATFMKKISDTEELFNPNVVKVICGKSKRALYFSRTPLPYIRGVDASDWISEFSFYKHIGIYAYRASVLKEIAALQPSKLEEAEGLEQLRWLENGFKIFTEETDYESISVDTPEDLSKLTNKF